MKNRGGREPAILFSLLMMLCLGPVTVPAQSLVKVENCTKTDSVVLNGAERTDVYLPLLKGRKVAVVGNHTSLVNRIHLVDTLLAMGVNVKRMFAPEHGFRGEADAGEHQKTYKDKKTGLTVVSLYGSGFKPSVNDLKDVDVVIFDIQDVGARFYTYISTMHYVMEACAEQKKKMIVLDRPNPNGHYVDGPVREDKYKSFVGMHPVPIVHGMTIGEYAKMVNGEGWLKNGVKCDLEVITVANYSHKDLYELPVKPSPNLVNMKSVYLYPSLCLFEGTIVSVGRGTEFPFQVIGHPRLQNTNFEFTPRSTPGAKNPPYKDTLCKGHDLRNFADVFIMNSKQVYLFWLMGCYRDTPDKGKFFNTYFNLLAGNATLRQQIIDGVKEEEIRKSWEPGLKKFKEIRKKYLLYEDFE
jgi:uncharacterized protein YbbC (DUF1343 family)